MNLREKQAPHLAKAFSTDRFGQLVEYKGEEISAIFSSGINPKFVRSGPAPGGSAAQATLQVMKSDIPVWDYRDSVVIAGVIWKVKGEGSGSSWFKFMLLIERDRRAKP